MTNKKLPILLILFFLPVVLLLRPQQIVRGSSNFVANQSAQYSIYADALSAGWVDTSWYTDRNLSNAAPVQSGSQSISVAFNNAWAGLFLHKDGGVSVTNTDSFIFYVHGGTIGGQKLRLILNQNDNAGYDFSPVANAWKKIVVPLSSLGTPTSVIDICIKDTTGAVQPIFYVDQITVGADVTSTNTPANTATKVMTKTNTSTQIKTAVYTLTRSATAQPSFTSAVYRTSTRTLTRTSTQGATLQSQLLMDIYSDTPASGWYQQSWYVDFNLANTTPIQSGSKSISVSYNNNWAAFYLKNDTGISTAVYNQLQFFIYPTGSAANLKAVVNENGNQAYLFTAPVNVWTKVTIPLSAVGSPAMLKGIWLQEQNGAIQPTFYLDSVSLVGASGAVPTATKTTAPTATKTSQPQATATSTVFLPTVTKTATPTLKPTSTPTQQPTAAPTAQPTQPSKGGDLTLYADSFNSDWQNWSWGSSINADNTSPVHTGSKSIAVTITSGWSAFYLHNVVGYASIGSYSEMSFWINGGSAGNQKIRVQMNGDISTTYEVIATANQWTQVHIPLTQFGSPTDLLDLYWQDETNGAQPTFYLDDITFTGTAIPTPTPAPASGPSLNIDASANQHDISADIYGMNWADAALAAELHLPVNRWGGNATTRYNWQNENANRASDWFFENYPNSNGKSTDFINTNRNTGTNTILTLPMIGWAPKDGNFSCAFSVAKYGPQQYTDSSHSDCGNGKKPDGTNITGNDPTDTSVAIGPAFVQDWVRNLISLYGTADKGGVKYYNLDNEPMLWPSTHRDVHPNPTSYDEMRDRTYAYASALKAVDPTAKTLGPVLWGWTAYFYSAADGNNWGSPPDRNAHGGTPFVEWYLQQMQAYEQTHGTRILDYLDLHFYPQESNVALSNSVDSSTQALRLRSTRALWDTSYTDESWINDNVRLLPRMKDWVSKNYPGTKTSLTEYNWGALNHINGALAEADVLGIFGREGLDLATLWAGPASTDPGAFAFRMYRNYDGNGSAFGDVSIQSISADQDKLSVYAATRKSDGALTIMVINKSKTDQSSSLSLANFSAASNAQVYRYSTANLHAIVHQADQSVSGSFTANYPVNSITLIVIPHK